MNISRKTIFKIIFTLGVAFAIGLLIYSLPFLFVFREFHKEGKETNQRQLRLLCQTDHQVLLEACREISRKAANGDLRRGTYEIRTDPNPEISKFPQVILNLEPTYVIIEDDGRLILELGGSLHHFGGYAYPEDYKYKVPISDYYGDKELIHGLWFYSDGYRENPEYQKYIEELLQKGKMRQIKNNKDSAP